MRLRALEGPTARGAVTSPRHLASTDRPLTHVARRPLIVCALAQLGLDYAPLAQYLKEGDFRKVGARQGFG